MIKLNIIAKTIKVIQTVQNPDLDEGKKDWEVYFLCETFGYAAQLVTREEIGQAAALVVTALINEKDKQAKAWFIDALDAAIINNDDIYDYIDFEALIGLLSRHSIGVDDVISLLGYSRNREYVQFIEQYSDVYEIEVFDALCRLCWDASGRTSEVEHMLRMKEIREINFLLINPKKRTVTEAELQTRYSALRKEVLEKVQMWFSQHSERS